MSSQSVSQLSSCSPEVQGLSILWLCLGFSGRLLVTMPGGLNQLLLNGWVFPCITSVTPVASSRLQQSQSGYEEAPCNSFSRCAQLAAACCRSDPPEGEVLEHSWLLTQNLRGVAGQRAREQLRRG